MKIYFIRHGQTVLNKNKILTGQTETPLTEEGIEQAQEALKSISNDFNIIYSSDLDRCLKTAEILNTNMQVPVISDARLRERNFGSFGGKTWLEADPTGELRQIDKDQKYNYRPYGGESAEDVKERILSCVGEIKSKYPNEKVLVVSSGGVIRLLHTIFHDEIHGHIANASIHEFEF